jgi:uncharacterized membrane protein
VRCRRAVWKRSATASSRSRSWAAYLVSFAVIGIIWINHHAAFAYVRRVDRGLLFLNLNLLLRVALIPSPTSVLAHYMQAGGRDERSAALVYALTMTLMGVSFGGMWLYITRHAEVARLSSARVLSRRISLRPGYLLGPRLTAILTPFRVLDA